MRFAKPQRVMNAKETNGFPSKLESAVYDILTLRERAGEIKEIRRQHVVELQGGARDTRITWAIDFSFIDCKTDEICFAEAKGFATEIYKLKLKMFRFKPHGRLEIYGGDYRRPKLIEVIEGAAWEK